MNETIEQNLTEFKGNDSVKLYFCEKNRFGLAVSVAPYISMEDFMDAFRQSTEMVEEHELRYFIFDKRTLRAFHQPSMEWYFVQWKPRLRELGLTTHFKILPQEDWFKKCVEAGREDIRKAYGDEFLEGISINYVDNIKEAINQINEHSRTTSAV